MKKQIDKSIQPKLGSALNTSGTFFVPKYISAGQDPALTLKKENVNYDSILYELNNLHKEIEINIDWGKEVVFYTTSLNNEIIVILRLWDANRDVFLNLLNTSLLIYKNIKKLYITEELFSFASTKKRLQEIKKFYRENYILNYSQYLIDSLQTAERDLMQEQVNKINEQQRLFDKISAPDENDEEFLPF